MSDYPIFLHRKTRLQEAIRFIIPAMAIAVVGTFAVEHLVKAGETVIFYISLGLYAFCAAIVIIFAIPNLLRRGTFDYRIDNEKVSCKFPDGTGYEFDLDEIKHLEKEMKTSMPNWVQYDIRLNNGKTHTVYNTFALSPEKVFSHLRKRLPDLEVVKQVNY